MRQLQSSLLALGMLIAPVLGASSCSFPDYTIQRTEPGAAGLGGNGAQVGGGAAGTGASAGTPGAGGGGGDSVGGAASGASGDGGDGGEGGTPHVSSRCVDLEKLLAPDCTCADHASHAYVFCSMTRPFSGAASQCSFLDAHLVKIEGTPENGFLAATASSSSMPTAVQYFWIGASTVNSPGTWHWGDDEVFWTGGAMGTPTPGAYFNWRNDRPQNTATQSCAYMDLDGGWQDGDCTQNRPYVCEAD